VELYLSNSNDFLILEVRDKGIGIREEDMKSLFTPFFRGKNVGTVQGTGLGLSIVKKAVDLLKGEIKIISRSGKGTTITVLLPLKV
jgi:signal transduction histidine kinase